MMERTEKRKDPTSDNLGGGDTGPKAETNGPKEVGDSGSDKKGATLPDRSSFQPTPAELGQYEKQVEAHKSKQDAPAAAERLGGSEKPPNNQPKS